MADNRVELVKLLVKRTAEGGLKWEYAENGAVKTTVGSSIIVIDDQGRDDDEVDIIVTVVNDGRVVENFTDIDLFNIEERTYYAEMKSLLAAARRSASGADQILSDIISALQASENP